MARKIKSYYDLAEHNTTQTVIFFVMAALMLLTLFHGFLPILDEVIQTFLKGQAHNITGDEIPYVKGVEGNYIPINYYTSWVVDVYLGMPEETRYWFSPALSFAIPISLGSLFITVIITALLPDKYGLFRQNIEREIIALIEKIAHVRYGFKAEKQEKQLENEIMSAKLRDLHALADSCGMTLEDLKSLQRGLIWQNSSFLYKVMNLKDGINLYMRFHFTIKYGNAILGLVYFGAATLIVIIGLRGLKLIPSNQPSMIIFALGLEFSLLVVYALTLMYAKQEDETELDKRGGDSGAKAIFTGLDVDDVREVERLMRVFLQRTKED